MNFPSRAWLSNFATQALATALGTLLAALVVVLGAAAFGYFKHLSASQLVVISGIALGLVALLVAASQMWQAIAAQAEMQARMEVLARMAEHAREQAARREEEIQKMEDKGKPQPE